jgi:outer membrane protein assembly factor BamB
MHKLKKKPSNRFVLPPPMQPYPNTAGNVLIYVVVLMLIFGVLGVVMVSLFTSTTASTVTRNDTRRARYMAESGMRYAFSELRNNDFDPDVINTLSTTTYTLNSPGSFTINVFGPWFDSLSEQIISDSQLTLNVPEGELPDNYDVPDGLWVINFEYTGSDTDETYMRSDISNYQRTDDTTFTFDVSGDFNVRDGDVVCLGVQPAFTQSNLSEGDDIVVAAIAQDFFPKFGGAININRVDYSYERLVEEGGQIKLKNISTAGFRNTLTAFPLTVANTTDGGGTYNGEFIVLSPRNHTVIPTGTSDAVSYGGDLRFGLNIFDYSLPWALSKKPDISADELTSNLSDQETDTRFFEVDALADELYIGGGLSDQFGSAFYAGTQTIGGQQNYCQQGACLFNLGVRVFFLLSFSQQGEGITFTLTNAATNSASSVGGDFQLSELMGYAGDSRLIQNPDPLDNADFLASTAGDRGLDPPKIAVEFDTQTNEMVGDPPPDYCANASTANTETRNDPIPFDPPEIDPPAIRDMVQYVFWGRTSSLNIPCRDFNPLYDDNRHDAYGEEPAEQWRFATGGTASFWRPAIGSDGTIYMSARDATLYALNQDGTEKWTFPLGDNNEYMPGIDTKGTSDPSDDVIYSDIQGNKIIAVDWEGNLLWQFDVASDIDSTPIVGPDGRVYFGTDNQLSLFAIDPDARATGQFFPQPGEWQRPTLGEVDGVAALSPDDPPSVVYFVASAPDNNLYAVSTADGSIIWQFPLIAEAGELNSSPAVNPADGTVYVGSDDHNVYAFNPAARTAGLPFPQPGEWTFTTGADVESSPAVAVDPIDGNLTVYIGSDDDNVYALDAATGSKKWEFRTGGPNVVSSPIVDLDGTVYAGSEDGNLYALKPAARLADPNGFGGLNALEGEWAFATGGQVRSSPAIGGDGFVFIGSNDTNFYTISQYGDPRNFKDEDKSLGKLLTVEDLDSSVQVDSNTDWLNGASSKGSWAVRMEVECLLRDVNEVCTSNADGDYEYELRLWIRQCPDQEDFPCSNILGTFYQDTRIAYDYTAVEDLPMRQQIRLNATEQAAFERFFFGFTGAAGAEALDATVSQFQLSFIRPGDPVVDCDKNNWPLEDSPPLPDCTLLF